MARLWLAVAFTWVLLGCGRTHLLHEGTYAFTADEIIRDDCGLLPGPGPIWGGKLSFSGDLVQLDYGLFGIQLVGQYHLREEVFAVDGTAANVATPVNGQACLVDMVGLHLEGATDCETQFSGTLGITYTTQTNSQNANQCACQVWLKFHAVEQPDGGSAVACTPTGSGTN